MVILVVVIAGGGAPLPILVSRVSLTMMAITSPVVPSGVAVGWCLSTRSWDQPSRPGSR